VRLTESIAAGRDSLGATLVFAIAALDSQAPY